MSVEDHDECLDEGTCEGGACVNIPGSFNCFCSPPFILDSTGRRCISVNGTDGESYIPVLTSVIIETSTHINETAGVSHTVYNWQRWK